MEGEISSYVLQRWSDLISSKSFWFSKPNKFYRIFFMGFLIYPIKCELSENLKVAILIT